MFQRFFSVVIFCLAALMLPAHARETPSPAPPMPPVPPALAEAMKYFNVIYLADPVTGRPVVETRRNADGTGQRDVIVAFIDAEDTRNQLAASGGGASFEGRLVNAGVLIANSGSDVIWRGASANTEFTASGGVTVLGYFLRNEADIPLTQKIDGKDKTLIYMDKGSAQKAKESAEAKLAAAGNPVKLIVAPVDALDLIEKVRTGERTDLVFASANSTERWLVQWQNGARRISDYKDESQEAIEALAGALFQ
jgi:hypothetical protein